MNVHITVRHEQVNPIVREYIDHRMQRVMRLTERVQGVHVVVDHVREVHEVEAVAHTHGGPPFHVKVSGRDLRGAIDACEEKLSNQVRHWVDRHKQHH